MQRNLKSSPDDYELLPGGLEIERKGGLVTWRFRERHDLGALKKAISENGKDAAIGLSSFAESFVRKCDEVDPVALLFQIIFFCAMGPDQEDEARHFAARDALIEFCAGLALSVSKPGSAYPDPAFAFSVVNDFPELTQAIEQLYLAKKFEGEVSCGKPDRVRFLLGLESLFDRMEGYVQHLQRINRAVYEGISSPMRTELGFSFANVPAIVSALVEIAESKTNASVREAAEGWNSQEIKYIYPNLTEKQRMALATNLVVWVFSTNNAIVDVAAVGAKAKIPEEEVEAMLDTLSAQWGESPDYRSPLEKSPLRDTPVLKTPRGFSIPLPYSLLHDQFRLFEILTNHPSRQALRSRYLRSRDRATEELGRQVLDDVFDGIAKCRSVEYQIEGTWFECDGLVVVEPVALILEAKAHSMTEAGRRGAPQRLKKKFRELIDTPVSQALRLASVLTSNEVQIRDRGTKQSIKIGPVDSTTVIALTFERIDPLQHNWLKSIPNDMVSGIWPICLADLLMVGDLLPGPCEFLAYAWLRSELTADRALNTTMESDVLGGFFQNRLRDLLALRASGHDHILLGYHAKLVNEFFTRRAMGLSAKPPELCVPGALEHTLLDLMKRRSPHWPKLLELVYAQEPAQWESLRRVIKKVKRTGRPRRCHLSDPEFTIEVVKNSDFESSAHSLVIDVSAS